MRFLKMRKKSAKNAKIVFRVLIFYLLIFIIKTPYNHIFSLYFYYSHFFTLCIRFIIFDALLFVASPLYASSQYKANAARNANFSLCQKYFDELEKFKTLKNGLNYIKQKNKDKKTVSVVRDCEILSGK